MKQKFTLLFMMAFAIVYSRAKAQCNYSLGANGTSIATPAAIAIDGNMADWAVFLNDPDNNSYDNTGNIDRDAPIADAGRDLTRFTFTENASNLFIYMERAGSSNNTVDIIFYADINNNGMMEAREPVIHMNWSGANGNVSVHVLDYVPVVGNPTSNNMSQNLDGSDLLGTLAYRGNIGSTGQGSADGRFVEVRIPFANLTRLNTFGTVTDQLVFGRDFQFHLSTINGNVSSIPNQNSINDNFGGCLRAPDVVLPVKMNYFSAQLFGNNKVDLKWSTATEVNASHFVIEKSDDGKNYYDAGVVFAIGNSDNSQKYSFIDNITSSGKGLFYYRLRQVDIDGRMEYSAVRIIRSEYQNEKTISLTTYPNPFTSEIRITIPTHWQNKNTTYELINANGQIANRFQVMNSSQTEIIEANKLAPGFYLVKVTCGNETATAKIIKDK